MCLQQVIHLEVLFKWDFMTNNTCHIKPSWYFCSVLFDISLWKDLVRHNAYKLFNCI